MQEERVTDSDRIIYTPTAFAKSNLLYLQEAGILETDAAPVRVQEKLASFLFMLVTKGSGMLTYDGNTYQLKKGDCVFINCRKPYAYASSEELWTLKWIHFNGYNMSGIYEQYIENGGQTKITPPPFICTLTKN